MSEVDLKAWDLASVFLKRESVYLWGNTGVGKSFLATLLIRERCSRYLNKMLSSGKYAAEDDWDYLPSIVDFIFCAQLIIALKHTWKKSTQFSEQDVIQRYCDVPCLFFDDIGTEETHDLSIASLTSIIDYRAREGKHTIFTSNLRIDELSKKLGDRLASRVTGMCGGGQNIIEITGHDRRLAVQGELALCR